MRYIPIVIETDPGYARDIAPFIEGSGGITGDDIGAIEGVRD